MKNLLLFIFFVLITSNLSAGAAFAVAQDANGNDTTWTFFIKEKAGASVAAQNAITKLKAQGHKKVVSPASTGLSKGYYAVVSVAYEYKGMARMKYGFGFSSKSKADAEKQAKRNLAAKDKFFKKHSSFDEVTTDKLEAF